MISFVVAYHEWQILFESYTTESTGSEYDESAELSGQGHFFEILVKARSATFGELASRSAEVSMLRTDGIFFDFHELVDLFSLPSLTRL